jgi:DNA-binding CsgD family transcriptional regulator
MSAGGAGVLAATSVDALARSLSPFLRTRFAAPFTGIYLYGDDGRPTFEHLEGLPVGFTQRYEREGRTYDPVQRKVARTLLPADDRSALDDGAWECSRLYMHVSHPFGLEHILTGPIVIDDRLVGTIHLARDDAAHPFGQDELLSVAMICGEVASTVARCTRQRAPRLSSRERDVVDLVAAGLANKEIGARLGISENTVKKVLKQLHARLGVHARAELVARCRVP